MRCDLCDGNTNIIRGQRYHYTESGLPNVYLLNIELRVCESCGEATPRIPRITELHATIARHVALKPTLLRGAEIRFLRKQLGMRAREWTNLLRISSPSTFSRWENDEQRPGPQSDALLRYIYFYEAEARDNRPMPENLAGRIASVQEDEQERVLLVDVLSHQATWLPAAGESNALAAAASAGAGARSKKHGSLPTGRLTNVRSQVVGETVESAASISGKPPTRAVEKGVKAA